MMALGTLAEELADCRAAWEGSDATAAWHLHHDILAEALTESAERRIEYILANKPEAEQALRLRLFRPMAARRTEYERTAQAWVEYKRATDQAWQVRAECKRATDQVRAEYKRATDQAWADYERATDPAHARECPDCPWDGKTIFPGGREAGR